MAGSASPDRQGRRSEALQGRPSSQRRDPVTGSALDRELGRLHRPAGGLVDAVVPVAPAKRRLPARWGIAPSRVEADDLLDSTPTRKSVPRRPWFSIRQLVLACVVGLIVGVGGFLLTSSVLLPANGSSCDPIIAAGFDPWTGLPHGPTLSCRAGQATGENLAPTGPAGMQSDIALRQAIPVPLGFVVGAGLVLIVPTVRSAVKRRSP